MSAVQVDPHRTPAGIEPPSSTVSEGELCAVTYERALSIGQTLGQGHRSGRGDHPYCGCGGGTTQ